MLKGVSGASVSSKNGKPMRKCKFEVTSASLALRVSISDGKKRVVKWLNPYPQHKSIDSGPVLLHMAPGHEKAHLAVPSSKAQGEVTFPFVLGVIGIGKQSVSVVGESSKPPMESTVTSAMPEALTIGGSMIRNSDQASKLLAPILSSVIRYLVVEKAVTSCSSSDVVVLTSVKAGFSMGSVFNAEVTLGLGYRDSGSTAVRVGSLAMVAVVVQNRFSPLSNLGNGVEDEFMVGEDHGNDQRCHYHVHMTRQRLVGSVGEFQSVSRLHLFPWESNEGFDQSCGSGERFFCVGV